MNKGHGLGTIGAIVGEGSSLITHFPVTDMLDSIPQESNPLTPLLEQHQFGILHSTHTTPLPTDHQILRDMYNILTPTYSTLQNYQTTTSHNLPHSPIKQLNFARLLDENIFGQIAPSGP